MEPQFKTEQEAPNIRSECVKEEFYKWFENRGLLSELRAYMRQLMVKALEDSNANGKSGIKKKAATSPKLQAINLLLVDYLFHEDYLYTVSVFASEAQILESLPQYSRYVRETVQQHHRDPSCLPRFSRQETEDILDTLRLPPSRSDMEQAIQLYLTGQESLLTSVTRTLGSHHNTSTINNTSLEWTETIQLSGGSYQLWSKEMQNLLLMAGVKLQHIRRMQHKWECILEEEKRKSREESEKDQLVNWAEWEERLHEEVEKEMTEEKNRLQERDRDLNELANQLSDVHQDISLRLAQLQKQSDDLQERERVLQEIEIQQQFERDLLEQRLGDIETREEHLKLAMASLTKQTVEASTSHMDSSTQFQKNVAITTDASVQVPESAIPGPQVKPAPLPGPQVVCANTQTVNIEDHEQQTSLSLEVDPELQLELQLGREKINELQEENIELRAYALQQRQRIDELTNRAASLSIQLEESQVALTLLNGRESNQAVSSVAVAIPTLPTPQNVFVAPTFGFNSPQRQGAGEESLFNSRPQQATARPDGRRRSTRFAFSNNPNPASEESSPTDEVVQNARARIQQLEAESVAVQRNYQAFQTRLLNSDSVMFPPLIEHPRTCDPLLRVRRTDMLPFTPLSTNHQPYTLHNNNYRHRERRMQSPVEDNDSSSDQCMFYSTSANTPRLFTERNIRHYERWKQFKKKFQRRNDFDSLGNTSSDDDDNFRRPRRRNYMKKTTQKQQTLDIQEPNKSEACSINKNTTECTENQHELQKGKNQSENQNLPVLTMKEKGLHLVEKSAVPLKDKCREDRIKSEMEQSMKLIESVKVLLEVQNLVIPSAGTSKESLTIESLPKDSDDKVQNKISLTENTPPLTVKRTDPGVQKITGEENIKKKREEDVTEIICEPHDYNEFVVSKFHQKDSEIELREEKKDNAEQSPLSLNIPNLRLVSPSVSAVIEDRITSTDVAEQDSGDLRTASLTSASDILRELNSSKDLSDIQVSVGNDSQSEDFWN